MNPLLPWHTDVYESLLRRFREGSLPHALLFSGPAGIGKWQLADVLATRMLCESADVSGIACGQCHACQLVAAETHPDLFRLHPEENSKLIRVDQIRQLIESLTLSAHYGGYRLVLIHPAHAMNSAAANSLLKTLEEPPANTVIILISDRPAHLPATVRSRCQLARFAVPPRQLARDWLQQQISEGDVDNLLALSHGAPLAACALAQEERLPQRQQMIADWQALALGQGDPVKLAGNWAKNDVRLPLEWIYGWLSDMIRLRSSVSPRLINPDARAALHNLADGLDLIRIYDLLGRVEDAIRLQESAVNAQTLLEGILLQWCYLPHTASN